MKKIQLRHKLVQEYLNSCSEKLQKEPENIDLLKFRALLFNLNENYQKGIDDLNNVLERSPEDGDMFMLRGDCQFNLKEFDLAKHDYLRALKCMSPEILANMVESYIIKETILNEDELRDMEKVFTSNKENLIMKLLPGFPED